MQVSIIFNLHWLGAFDPEKEVDKEGGQDVESKVLAVVEGLVGGKAEAGVPLQIFGRRRQRMFESQLPQLVPEDRVQGPRCAVVHRH